MKASSFLSKTAAHSLFGFLALAAISPAVADVNSDLAFSAFGNIDLNRLANGQVLQSRSGLMEFQHGISTQSLYVIDATPADVEARLANWNASTHSELKVWMHENLPPSPTATDFPVLQNLPDNSSVNSLIDATASLTGENPALQVTKAEAQLAASLAPQYPDKKALFSSFWSQVLLGRISHFMQGRGGLDSYMNGEEIFPLREIRTLLHADSKIFHQFSGLISSSPVGSSHGGKPSRLYYECFDVEGSASLGTGAIYQAMSGTSLQSMDLEYYLSSGIYATVELEQLWPISLNGRNQTLVWRQDMVSTSNIAYLHGTERLASGMVMQQDVKQVIDAFRSDFK